MNSYHAGCGTRRRARFVIASAMTGLALIATACSSAGTQRAALIVAVVLSRQFRRRV